LLGTSFGWARTSESVPPDLAQTVCKLKVALDTIWGLRTDFLIFGESVGSSLGVGAIAGVFLIGAGVLFDRIKIDDPVGAISVHLVNGVFDILCVGLFAQDLVPRMTGHDLFFGGGTGLLFAQVIGIVTGGIFTFAIASIVISG
jgi:Ammonium Transporter Family